MATGGQKTVDWNLVKVGKLTLESTDKDPCYFSFVVCQNKIVVIDDNACKVHLHQLSDGKVLATSYRLESKPRDMCLMNEMEICVLHDDGLIKMMSIDYTDVSGVLKTTRRLRLQGVLDEYYGVARFKDNLVVSGVREGTMYWCVVSIQEGYVETINKVCEGYIFSSVATKDNMIYIACNAGAKSPNNGVYGFDYLKPSQCKYKYQHRLLKMPISIVINEDGYIFVCNYGFSIGYGIRDSCIHQLSDTCQLVSIFTQGIPLCLSAIFWDQGSERLYATVYKGRRDISAFQSNHHDSCRRKKSLGLACNIAREKPLPSTTDECCIVSKILCLTALLLGWSNTYQKLFPSVKLGPLAQFFF